MQRRHHPLWYASTYRLTEMDTYRARDLLVDCFSFTHRPTFHAVKERMGLPTTDEALRRSAENAVRLAFRQVGGEFDTPTVQSLDAVVEVLGSKAAVWGTPPQVIEHHISEMRRVVDMIE